MKKINYIFLIVTIFLYGCSDDYDFIPIESFLNKETVFGNEEGYRPVFRCPTVCITNQNTVLVACHNQQTWDDLWGIDILFARKETGAKNWEKRKAFVTNEEKGRSMSPIFLVDRASGRIYLFVTQYLDESKFGYYHTSNEIDLVYKFSDDDGRTWSEEISLRNLWDTQKYTAVVTSASNGIMLNDGTFLIPMMIIKDQKLYSSLLIKKVDGNWYFSSFTPNVWDNECTVYIDNQDRIILDCRTLESIRNKYVYDIEHDEFTQIESNIIESFIPIKAEISKCNWKGAIVYLMSYPETQTERRENLSLYGSKDGINWKFLYRLEYDYNGYGYSNVFCHNNKVVVSYETNIDIKMIDISPKMDEIVDLILERNVIQEDN